MSYSSSIPNASDPRAQSQRQILANFQAINTTWAVNHASLVGTDPIGQHKVLTMRRQTNDPTTTATQIALYSKLVSSIPELFFRPKNNGTPIQLTYSSVSDNELFPDDEQSFIAGPFIVYCGIIRNPAGIPAGTVKTLTGGTTLRYVSLTTFGATRLTVANTPLYAVATDLNTPANSFTVSYIGGTLKIPVLYYLAIGT